MDALYSYTNKRLFSNIDAQIDGDTKPLDLIKCNEDYCVNMVNIGFDCYVVLEVEKLRKKKIIPPSLSYIVGLVICFFFNVQFERFHY